MTVTCGGGAGPPQPGEVDVLLEFTALGALDPAREGSYEDYVAISVSG